MHTRYRNPFGWRGGAASKSTTLKKWDDPSFLEEDTHFNHSCEGVDWSSLPSILTNLKKLNVSTSTPGLSGNDRQYALAYRLKNALGADGYKTKKPNMQRQQSKGNAVFNMAMGGFLFKKGQFVRVWWSKNKASGVVVGVTWAYRD